MPDLNVLDYISSLHCPACKRQCRPFDGLMWTLTRHGNFEIACPCGRTTIGSITVKVTLTNA